LLKIHSEILQEDRKVRHQSYPSVPSAPTPIIIKVKRPLNRHASRPTHGLLLVESDGRGVLMNPHNRVSIIWTAVSCAAASASMIRLQTPD